MSPNPKKIRQSSPTALKVCYQLYMVNAINWGGGALSDRVFFPLAFTVAIAMIVTAAWRPPQTCPSGSVSVSSTYYKVIELSDKQLNRFFESEYTAKSPCSTDPGYVLALTTPAGSTYPPSPDVGPHFRMAPDIEAVFSGNQLKIIIEARSSSEAPALELNYHSGPEGTSGWERFDLTPEYRQYIFDYKVPKASQGQGVDYFALRPFRSETDQTVEIRKVTFLVLSLMSPEERRKALAEHVKR